MRRRITLFFQPLKTAIWLIQDAEGNSIKDLPNDEASQLELQESDEVFVIIPTEAILLTETTLPPGSQKHLRKLLPFALEENILGKLEDLHFATGPWEKDQPLSLALMDKNLLLQWLEKLEEVGIQADALIPLPLALPYDSQHWHLYLDGDQATVRSGPYTGFSTELANLPMLLQLKLAETEDPPTSLRIFFRDQKDQDLEILEALPLPLEAEEVAEEEWLEILSESIRQHPFINLLQAPYASRREKNQTPAHLKIWKQVCFLFFLTLGLLILKPFASYLVLASKELSLQRQVAKIYKNHFPEASHLGEPQKRMEAKLKEKRQEGEGTRFLEKLSTLAKNASGIRLQELSYENQELRLRFTASSLAYLENFKTRLKKESVPFTQESLSSNEQPLAATLLLERRTA